MSVVTVSGVSEAVSHEAAYARWAVPVKAKWKVPFSQASCVVPLVLIRNGSWRTTCVPGAAEEACVKVVGVAVVTVHALGPRAVGVAAKLSTVMVRLPDSATPKGSVTLTTRQRVSPGYRSAVAVVVQSAA